MLLFALKQWMESPPSSSSSSYYPLLVYLLLLAAFIYTAGRTPRRKTNLPPSPPKLPIIRNLHQLGSLPHRSLHVLSEKYGRLMLLHLGSIPTIVVSSMDMALEVLKTQDVVFASRPRFKTTRRLIYDCKDIAFSPYDEHWRQVRKFSVLHLLSAKIVQSFQVVREEEVASMVEKIRCFSSLGPVNLSEMLSTLTNDIICRVVVGKKYSGDEAGKNIIFHELMREILDLVGAFNVGDYIPSLAWLDKLSNFDSRLETNFRGWDRFLEGVIEEQLTDEKVNGKESNSFINLLLTQEKDDTGGISLNRNIIKAILMDMFVAATDTSSNTMVWTMAELLRHPQVMKKVQEEVRGVVGVNSKVCKEDIDQMNYLKLVVKETFRMYPPFPLLLPREATKDAKLGIYDIPAKTHIMVNAWAIARDPELWEEPEKFWPERFIKKPLDFNGHDFQYLPFGAGRRKCPGTQFAIASIELALANLLHHFDWDLPDGAATKDLDMTEAFGLNLYKKSNLVLVAKPHFEQLEKM